MTSRTWIAPAAWRNVPQVVETGKTSDATRNVRIEKISSGRSGSIVVEEAAPADGRHRASDGSPISPTIDSGTPRNSSTCVRLWTVPVQRSSRSFAGPAAR